jgi:putrescine aminotransferase
MHNSEEIFLNNIAQTTPFPLSLEIESAKGSYLFGPKGEAYLDLISGVGVSNFGHGHPKVITAIKKQLDKHLHTMVYGEYISGKPQPISGKISRAPARTVKL